jgi:pyruvate/2-oxoacid:ferredoxin oxidoreductase alpha subunit
MSFGTLAFPHSWYMEWRYKIQHAHDMAIKRFYKEAEAFEEHFGRPWVFPLERYRSDDAEVILVTMSTIASTAKDVVDALREEGRKVGLVRVTCFRPFPTRELRDALGHAKVVGVADRSHTFGKEGPLFTEVKASLYNTDRRPPMVGFSVGIGGRDVLDTTLMGLFDRLEAVVDGEVGKEVSWVDLTGEEEEVV